jgi:hypothetical protein
MSRTKVQINDLRLRVPGLTETQARQLGQAVAKRLADLPIGASDPLTIRTMSVRVKTTTGDSLTRLANEIAATVQRRLG